MKNAFLVGKDVYLRPLEASDVSDDYVDWMNDVEASQFIPAMTFPARRESIEAYIEKEVKNPNVVFLAVIEKESDIHIGNVKLGPINWLDRNAEYGRLIGLESAKGKGYGKEIVYLILHYAFDYLNLHKVFASCLASNVSAIKSNEKSGLTIEGVLKDKRYTQGRYEDVVYMGITEEEFRTRNNV